MTTIAPATRAQRAARASAARDPETLAFELREGDFHNHFFRRGPVAAHLLTNSGTSPRLIIAFPAGNTGIGVWFEPTTSHVELAVEGALAAVERRDGMRGISATLVCDAPSLRVRGAALGNIRAIRACGHTGEALHGTAIEVEPVTPFVIKRTSIDGEHHIELAIEPEFGTTVTLDADHTIVLASETPGGSIRVRVTALADDAPLTPIESSELLVDPEGADPHALSALAFLAYEEKLLAGSWRFLTYFGRDTLLSLRLLMPALKPAVIEAGLGSVLDRLAPGGDVAHEEAIGEWATREHLRKPQPPANLGEPILDYAMVDDDFLVAPVVAAYLLDHAAGRARARSFLQRRTPSGATYAEALRANLDLVLRLAAPFAEAKDIAHLIALKDGEHVGEWRDSLEGLGHGRVPWSVNAVLVPAALEAAARLLASTLLGEDGVAAARAHHLAEGFRHAGDAFRVEIPADEAKRRVSAYAASVGIDPTAALASIDGPITFPALALDAAGRPIPVMHSDDGFALLFSNPSPACLDEAALRILRPFPAGLRTPVGVVVANAAYSTDPEERALFTPAHYHGAVVWSWQQAMLAAGLRRQLEREDLPSSTRALLEDAERALWDVIRTAQEWSTSELWTWAVRDGFFELLPFGLERAHHDESNAAQLWSTVYLAVKPPPSAS